MLGTNGVRGMRSVIEMHPQPRRNAHLQLSRNASVLAHSPPPPPSPLNLSAGKGENMLLDYVRKPRQLATLLTLATTV